MLAVRERNQGPTSFPKSPKRKSSSLIPCSDDPENLSHNVVNESVVDCAMKPVSCAVESAKKKRKPKKKAKVTIAPVESTAMITTTVDDCKLLNAQEKANQEKENVLLALRSFIKVMEAHKCRTLAIPKEANRATVAPGSSKKRARETIQGCGSFTIPHEKAEAPSTETETTSRVLFAEPVDNDVIQSDPIQPQNGEAERANMDEVSHESEQTKEIVHEYSLGHCSKLGMSPGTFLKFRPETCSPVTDRFFEVMREECSPGSICLCAPTDEEFNPISIEMFNTIEAVWDNDTVTGAQDQDRASERSMKRARRSEEDRCEGLSPIGSDNVSVQSYEVLADHVKFSISTTRAGQSCVLFRRYADFEVLHKTLSGLIAKLPALPRKQLISFWGRWRNKPFLDKRQVGLDAWLKSVLRVLESMLYAGDPDLSNVVDAVAAVHDFLSVQYVCKLESKFKA